VFVLRKDIEEDFKSTVGARIRGSIEIVYVFQDISNIPGQFSMPEGRTKPWGTGHATLMAAQR